MEAALFNSSLGGTGICPRANTNFDEFHREITEGMGATTCIINGESPAPFDTRLQLDWCGNFVG